MMLINAGPRFVSNGIETFVPAHQVESLHQRLGEMTNNDVNAWSIPRPVATFPSESWDQQLDDFSSNENFPLHTLYSGYYQSGEAPVHHQAVNYQKTPTYSAVHQYQPFKMVPQQVYHEPVPEMSFFQKQSPMLGNDYAEMSLGSRNGSFSEFSNTRNAMKDFPYSPSTNTDFKGYAPALSTSQQTSYHEDNVGMGGCMTAMRSSPNTVYSGTSYSSSGSSVDPMSLVNSRLTANQGISAPRGWWQENLKNNKTHRDFEMAGTHDGLPRLQSDQNSHQFGDPWNSGRSSTNIWMNPHHSVGTATVSPKALTLNIQPPPMSSSGSNQGSVQALSSPEMTPSASSSSDVDYQDYSTPDALNVIVPIRKHRQLLPDSIPMSKRVPPVVPNQSFLGDGGARKRSLRSSDPHYQEKSNLSYGNSGSTSTRSTKASEPLRRPVHAPKRLEPKTALSPRPQQSYADKPQSAATVQAMHHRDAKDDFLVRSKLAGVPYKEIRKQGNFTEAESTLRGRFRTLTKHKNARVRKPEWGDNDLRLLKKAVRKLSEGANKIPWKLVAEYISDNGGSYHFGNATCRKKWDDLHGRG